MKTMDIEWLKRVERVSPEDYVYKQDKSIVKPLNDYIKQKHNQDECIGFIDGHETKQSENLNLYTENEIKLLFEKWIKLKSEEVGLYCLTFDKWFETVKK